MKIVKVLVNILAYWGKNTYVCWRRCWEKNVIKIILFLFLLYWQNSRTVSGFIMMHLPNYQICAENEKKNMCFKQITILCFADKITLWGHSFRWSQTSRNVTCISFLNLKVPVVLFLILIGKANLGLQTSSIRFVFYLIVLSQ